MPKIIAIVVNWNGRKETLACLHSLASCWPLSPAVILVDNGSTDGTVTAVGTAFPHVEIIELPTNRHFAAAANVGLRRALERGADYLWLLNNDVVVTPEALDEMVRVAQTDNSTGIVGAKLVHPFDPPGIIVGAYCDLRNGAIIEPALPDETALDRLVVDYVWGCSMLIRAQAAQQIGLLDASFIAYFEDSDYCLRARNAMWKTVTALRATVYHAGSRSANRRFLQQMWLRGRNWLHCYWRHASPSQRPRLLLSMVGYRLPHLAWSTLVTIIVRTLRPGKRPIRLWSRK